MCQSVKMVHLLSSPRTAKRILISGQNCAIFAATSPVWIASSYVGDKHSTWNQSSSLTAAWWHHESWDQTFSNDKFWWYWQRRKWHFSKWRILQTSNQVIVTIASALITAALCTFKTCSSSGIATAHAQLNMLTMATHLRILLRRINSAQHGQYKCCRFPRAWLWLGYHVLRPATECQLRVSTVKSCKQTANNKSLFELLKISYTTPPIWSLFSYIYIKWSYFTLFICYYLWSLSRTNYKSYISYILLFRNKKDKAILVTGREGPQGYETLRLPHFPDNRLIDGGEAVSHTSQSPFTPQEDSWYLFMLGTESTPGP
jgi:hypothetical protein